jgi:flagellin
MYINTNIASLDAQNNLSSSQMSLQTSLQRLSSGLRINSAKDDAAGLAISTRMSSQIAGLSQASQNANDGISMSQTAEGGMSTIADNLQRMRSLAVQAANGSNSTSDRQSIQAEIAQLQSQINQVATETQYNGTNLLDGSLSNAQFQIGANANQTLNMSIGNLQASALGSYALKNSQGVDQGYMTQAVASTAAVGGAGTAALPWAIQQNGATGGNTISISGNGTTGSITTNYSSTTTAETADQIAAQINNNSAIQATGVTATAATTVVVNLSGNGTNAVSLNLYSNSSAVGASPVKVSVSNGSGTNDLAGLVSSINSQSGTSGITATFNQTAGTITLSNSTGQDIAVQNASNAASGITVQGASGIDSSGNAILSANNGAVPPAAATTPITLGATGAAGDLATVGGQVSFSSPSSYSVNVAVASAAYQAANPPTGTQVAPTANTDILGTGTTTGSTLNSVNNINVDTIAGANSAIQVIDAALLNVNNQEANMGAVQNRFTSVISNLSTAGQNLTSARSLIQDTNFASETANLTRAQILQQAGTAMLAQANSAPNGVMALLK